MPVEIFNHLEIETIGSCNRSCTTCLRQSYINKSHPTHHGRFPVVTTVGEGIKMPSSTFRRIIDQAVDYGFEGAVGMQHFNEPLLDDRLEELASYVKSKQQIKGPLSACTNMDLINEERAKNLDGLFDYFTVALYMPENRQAQREEYLKSLFKKTRLVFTKGVHLTTHFSPNKETAAAVDQQRFQPCTQYNHMLIIAYNGTVLHCCDDYVGHFGLGDVNTMTVQEIWENEVHSKLVSDLSVVGGRMNYQYCAVCPR